MDLLVASDNAFTQTRTKPTHTDLENAILGHWARAGVTSIGVLRLCEQSYADLAMALNRVLGEILTSLAWLLVKPADQASRADRYWKFAEVEADDEATLFEMVGWANDAASLRGRIDAEVVADARELFPKVYLGWTQCKNTDALDKAVAHFWTPDRWRTIERLLRLTRGWGNDHAHAGASLTLRRVYVSGTDRTIDLRGRADLIPRALVVAASLYQEVAGIASQAMGISEMSGIWPQRPGAAS
jgi:hypothetical protein